MWNYFDNSMPKYWLIIYEENTINWQSKNCHDIIDIILVSSMKKIAGSHMNVKNGYWK